MKKLLLGALVTALCVVPGLTRAASSTASRPGAAPAQRHAQARPTTDRDTRSSDAQGAEAQNAAGEESEYAAREKAAPQLAEFSGGDNGVYIGTGALVVALLVVLLITAL
jgi:hypothetical protein